MEFEARVLCGMFVLSISVCYLCGATPNYRRDIRSTSDKTKMGANNKSRNDTGKLYSFIRLLPYFYTLYSNFDSYKSVAFQDG